MFNLRVFSIVLVLTGVTMLAGFGGGARGAEVGPCGVTITKVAPGGEDTEFPFEHAEDGGEIFSFPLLGGHSEGGPFSSTSTVTELPLEGWVLTDIECENTGATSFDITDNGFTATCDGSGDVTCTFFNVPVSSNIPTLSEWGMIASAAGLILVGVFFAVRRRKAVVNL